jgi:hypothetical protein
MPDAMLWAGLDRGVQAVDEGDVAKRWRSVRLPAPDRNQRSASASPEPSGAMDRRPLETRLAYFSLVAATVHLVFETAYHLRFGQFLPMLLVDYIAIALLVGGSWTSLRARPAPAPGLLCGAWGFTFCLAYRTFFWRVEDVLYAGGRRGSEPDALLWVLGFFLFVSALAFLLTVALVLPRPRRA